MAPIANQHQFPSLYYPESVEELLTQPIIEMLMIGYTTTLGGTPVALQDRNRRYDFPSKHWTCFCRTLRKKYGMNMECEEWDDYVVNVLLNELSEQEEGDAEKYIPQTLKSIKDKIIELQMPIKQSDVIYKGKRVNR